MTPHRPWTPSRSAELYRTDAWGSGYFTVSEKGTVMVHPTGDPAVGIDLYDVVDGLVHRDISTPVVIRFPELLAHRMRHIRSSFDAAIAELSYKGTYTCVYPIKVNQQRHLCEEIRRLAGELDFGLEVGSKPELLAGLALTAGANGMPLVCNGFKDDEFIETVVLASKMGRNIIPVVEQAKELDLIIRHARAHDVTQRFGIRAKLGTSGIGRWASSTGVRGKFGLSVSELLTAIDRLRAADMLDGLYMLHCHIGSQIYDIRTVKYAVSELAHIYVELVRLGAPLRALDIGGGLGIDYDGTQSASASSVNYTVEQYAMDVIHRIQSICDDAEVPHPDIISESGRAMIAHSSVLVFDVLGSRVFPDTPNRALLDGALAAEEVPQPLLDLVEAYQRLDEAELVELHADAEHALEEAKSLFNLGYIDIRSRAAAEELYWAVGWGILKRLGDEELPDALSELPDQFSDTYFTNMSVFQSLLDSWGIEQLFPIMPIHRLDEEPTRRGVLADITCDSDGKVDRFPGDGEVHESLELHALRPVAGSIAAEAEFEPYYLAVFLSAAYQETLGDLHNLLGDTHVVHVVLAEDGRWRVEAMVDGDTVREVLAYVQYDPEEIRSTLRRDIETALEGNRVTLVEARSLRRFLDDGLNGYTYLE